MHFLVKPSEGAGCPILPARSWGRHDAISPSWFLLTLQFICDDKRIYPTRMAHTDPGPGRLGLNSAALTHFSQQNVAFLVAHRGERFHPDLLGCAECSWVPYECVGLSAMGRKLLLQNLKGRNFQQKMHCRGWESRCCSSALPEFSSGCLLIQFSFCTWSKKSWKQELQFSCLPRKQQNDCWVHWNRLEKLTFASLIQAQERHTVTAPCIGSASLVAK